MVFIETTAFTKLLHSYLSMEEYQGLQSLLMQFPETGKVIPRSGGVRKLRWNVAGKGKRGGVRVIYYYKGKENEIWFLSIYSKNEAATIPAHVLKQIAKEIEK